MVRSSRELKVNVGKACQRKAFTKKKLRRFALHSLEALGDVSGVVLRFDTVYIRAKKTGSSVVDTEGGEDTARTQKTHPSRPEMRRKSRRYRS